MIKPGANGEFEADSIRFSFTSPLVCERVYDYNLRLKKLILLHEEKINGIPQCEIKHIFIESNGQPNQSNLNSPHHRQEIDQNTNNNDFVDHLPLTIIRPSYKHSNEMQKENMLAPLLLLAYGAYGHTTDAEYRPFLIPLLKR